MYKPYKNESCINFCISKFVTFFLHLQMHFKKYRDHIENSRHMAETVNKEYFLLFIVLYMIKINILYAGHNIFQYCL